MTKKKFIMTKSKPERFDLTGIGCVLLLAFAGIALGYVVAEVIQVLKGYY